MQRRINYLIIIFISFLLCVIWFRSGLIMGAGESGLPFYNLQFNFNSFKDAWNPTYLGSDNNISIASSLTLWFLSRFQIIGVPNYLIQAAFFFFLFTIAGISIYELTKILFPKLGDKYYLIACLFYWFNPLSTVNVWNRFLNNYFVFWAFLPLLVLFYLKGIFNNKYFWAVVVSITTVISSFALASTVFNILLWFVIFFISVFYFIFGKNKKIFIIKYFVLTLVTFLLFNAWWINQILSFLRSDNLKTEISAFFTVAGNLSTLSSISQRLGLLVNITRGIHDTFYNQGMNWALFFVKGPMVFVEFLIVGIVLINIFKNRSNESTLFLATLWIITIFLTKGTNPPFGDLFYDVFKKITFLQVFRNPFEKFGFVMALAFTPLFASSIDSLSVYISNKNYKNLFYISMLIFIFIIFGSPYWTGKVFTHLNGKVITDYSVKIPDYYQKAEEWLKDKDGRFLVLPIDGEGITYNWTNPYTGVESSNLLFNKSGIAFNTTIPYFQDYVNNLENLQFSSDLLNITSFADIKYIIFRSDVDYKSFRLADPEIIYKTLSDWEKQGLIASRYKEGAIEIFEILNKSKPQKIFVTKNIYNLDSPDLNDLFTFIPGTKEIKLSALNPRIENTDITNNQIISPKDPFIINVSYPAPKDLTSEDLLAKLFYSRHLPGQWYYSVVRVKEFIEEISQGNYEGWVIYKVGIMGKRAAEIFKLYQLNSDKRIIAKAENDYNLLFDNLNTTLKDQMEQGGPISQLIKDSLLYQWILLDRMNSKSAPSLYVFLINQGITPKYDLAVSDYDYVIYKFNVIHAGIYTIVFKDRKDIPNILLDGKASGANMFLNLGDHELVLSSKDLNIFSKVFSIDQDYYTKSNSPRWKIDLPNEPSKYLLEFDYRFVNNDSFIIKFLQDIENNDNPVFLSKLEKDKIYHGWGHYKKEFTTSAGASHANLIFEPDIEEVCDIKLILFNDCRKEPKEYGVEIKNLKLNQVAPPQVALTHIENSHDSSTTTDTVWKMMNPMSYKVHLNKQDNNPEILVFSELYNGGWKATYNNGEAISNDKHFLVNTFANGWVIDQKGEYDINIDFKPQGLMRKGRVISIYSVIVGLMFVGVLRWKERK